MRHQLTLSTETYEDILGLLEAAAAGCGLSMPDEITMSYRLWVESIQSYAEGQISSASFGPNVPEEIDAIIAAQVDIVRGDSSPNSGNAVSSNGAILKGFRDYFIYGVMMLPVGTAVYWKTVPEKFLHIVVTDGKAPKGYIKLI